MAAFFHRAFYICSSLTQIDIPSSVVLIGDSAFYKCSSLRDIVLHQGLHKIGKDAFCGLQIVRF
jgi:hypothetical protein